MCVPARVRASERVPECERVSAPQRWINTLFFFFSSFFFFLLPPDNQRRAPLDGRVRNTGGGLCTCVRACTLNMTGAARSRAPSGLNDLFIIIIIIVIICLFIFLARDEAPLPLLFRRAVVRR